MNDETVDEVDARLDLAAFDVVSPPAALELVRPVCGSPAWMDAMVARRPYGTLARATEVSDAVIAGLGWPQVLKALEAHPRIGERAPGDAREAAWSRQEQSAADPGDDGVERRLYEGNVAYEAKFGHVFLICATGRTAPEILEQLTERQGHDRAQEQLAVRRELTAIVRLRLARTLR